MTFYDRLNEIFKKEGQSAHAERICAQMRFAAYLSKAQGGVFDKTIDEAAVFLLNSAGEKGVIEKKDARKAEKMLLPLSKEAKKYKVHLVAHAHIDMNWLWGYEETAAVTVNTFRTMIDLLSRYPSFTFSQSQASTYEICEKYAPELLDRISGFMKEGRWEFSSSTWVENDENMPCAESLARHQLYTRRYFKKLFGEDAPAPALDFQPDTFGHAASIPDICASAGVKWFYHCRGNDGSESAYIWQGAGGAELLVWCDPQWYGGGISPRIFDRVPGVCEKYGVSSYLSVYGVGDHGGGPTARDIEKLIELQSWPLMPTLVFSSYRAFFEELEASEHKLPRRQGECNFIFSGCYSSQSETKARNRLGEARLIESEALSAMAGVWAHAANDRAIFETAWRKLLFSQFHDILPGSGVRATGEYASGCFQEVDAAAVTRAEASMRSIAEQISLGEAFDAPFTGGGAGSGVASGASLCVPSGCGGKKRAFHLFCQTQNDYEGVCTLTVWDWRFDGGRAVFTDVRGERIPFVMLSGNQGYWGHEFKTFLLYVKVPGCGYTTVFLDEEPITDLPAIPIFENRVLSFPEETLALDNGLVRAVFSRKTAKLLSLVDLSSGCELLSGKGGCFRLGLEDRRQGMTAWKEGMRIKEEDLGEVETVFCSGVSASPLRSSFSFGLTFGDGSKLNVNVSLDRGSKLLRFETDVQWFEKGGETGVPRLDAVFSLKEKKEVCRYGAPLAPVDRPALPHDVPGFFACTLGSNAGKEALLMSKTKYGFRCTGDQLSLTLLRSSLDPDPLPEYGSHRFEFSFGFAPGTSKEKLFETYENYIHVPIVCPGVSGKGSLPPEDRLLSLEGAQLLCLKRAENGEGVVLRMTNLSDKEKTFRLKCSGRIAKAAIADLHETPLLSLRPSGSSVSGRIKTGEFLTLLVSFA